MADFSLGEATLGTSVDISGLREGIRNAKDEAESGFGRVAGVVNGALKVGFVAATASVTALGAGIVAATKGGLEMNSSMEQVSAKLKAMTGSGDEAAKILAQIKEEAAKTPFAFNAMAEATAALVPSAKQANVPLMDLVKTAEILAASNPAEGLEGAAFALKEAVSGDFASIIERFNLPRQRLKELREQGVPDLEAVKIAMNELGLSSELVTGMAETMEGRWSTFLDTVGEIQSTMSQPIFDALKEGLMSLQTLLDENKEGLKAMATELGQNLAGAVKWFFESGLPALKAGWESLQPALSAVASVFGQVWNLFQSFMSGGAGGLVQALGLSQDQIATLQRIIAVVLEVTDKFKVLANEGLAYLGEKFQWVKGWIDENMPLIKKTIETVLNAMLNFWREHGDGIISILRSAWDIITDVIDWGLETIGSLIKTVMLIITGDWDGAWAEIKGILSNTWETLKDIASKGLDLLVAYVKEFYPVIQGQWQAVWDGVNQILSRAWEDLKQAASEGLNRLWGGLKNLWDNAIKPWWDSQWANFTTALRNKGNELYSAAYDTLQRAKEGLQNKWNEVTGWWRDRLNDAVQEIENTKSRFYNAGSALISNLWDGLRANWDNLKSWFSGSLQSLRDMLPGSEPKDRSSPLYGLGDAGEALISNVQAGIDRAGRFQVPGADIGSVMGSMFGANAGGFALAGAGASYSKTFNLYQQTMNPDRSRESFELLKAVEEAQV